MRNILYSALLFSGLAFGQFATFSSVNSGSLGSTSFNVDFTSNTCAVNQPSSIETWDLTEINYNPSGRVNEPYLDHAVCANPRFVFASPINGVDLYLIFYRGSEISGPGTYTITPIEGVNGSWSIQSGMQGASINGNTLTVPPQFTRGILRYSGSLRGVAVTAVGSSSTAHQGTTLAARNAPVGTPISNTALLSLTALLAMAGVWAMQRRPTV